MRIRDEIARRRGHNTLIAFVCGLILAVAAAWPATAHELSNAQDPNVAGDSSSHAAADAVDIRTASSQLKMIKRIKRIARARANKRRALGLPQQRAEVSDQGVRQRGFLQALGFDVSLVAPNLFEPNRVPREPAPTAAASTMARTGAFSVRSGGEHTSGLWSPVIWPIYQVNPGDPDYNATTNANPTPTGSGTTANPPGDSGDTPAAPDQATNPNPRIVPVFEALMPDGKVLYWDWLISGWFKDPTAVQSTRILLWDPMHPDQPGQRLDVNGANLFCAGYSHLPNGDLFLAGGNSNNQFHGLNVTYIYHWRTKTWEEGPDMSRLRWYPSVAAMYNGEQMILGGDPPGGYGNPVDNGTLQNRSVPEIFSPHFGASQVTDDLANANRIRQLDSIRFGNDTSGPGGSDAVDPPSSRGYPFLVPSVDGRVLYGGYESETYLIDSTKPGVKGTGGTGASARFGDHDPFWRVNGTFVNYNVGKVLLVGGGTSAKYGDPTQPTTAQQMASCSADEPVENPTNPLCQPLPGQGQEHGATKTPTYIDILNSNWDEDKQGLPGGGNSLNFFPHAGDMHFNRRFDYATALPDGKVLVSGGMENTDPDPGDNPNNDDFNNNLVNPADGVKAAELWDPQTEQFTTLASASVVREYHSTALLLPDGRVLTGGGGVCGPCTTNGEHYYNPNFEIFSPPYLFNDDDSLAERPTITTGTHSDGGAQVLPAVDYNQAFDIAYTPGRGPAPSFTPRDVQTAALLKLGTPTHSTDVGQRFVPLDFDKDPDAHVLHMTAPINSYVAPPGFYMLFVVDSHGTPSIAKMIQLGARLPLANKTSVVDVFANGSYGGTAQYLGIGEYTQAKGNFANVGTNQISSVKVAAGYQVTLCPDSGGPGVGTCQTFTSDQSSLSGGLDNNVAYAKVTRIPVAPPGDQPPNVTITSPANNSTTTQFTGELHFTATDDSGETPTCDMADGQTLNYNNGTNTIVVHCQDEFGHTGTDSVTVYGNMTDSVPPVITITAPADNTTTHNASVVLNFSVTDNAGPAIVCNYGNGQIVPLTAGANVITVECHDQSNNSSSASTHVSYLPSSSTPTIPDKPGLLVPSRVKLAKTIKFRASCPSGCRLSATIVYGAKKLKLKSQKLKAADNQRASFALSSSQRKKLKAAKKKMKVWLVITVTDDYRQSANFTAQLK